MQGEITESVKPRSIYARICHYIMSSPERIGDIGEHLITSAQKDLDKLKQELLSLTIKPQEKETLALYAATVITRMIYTPIILTITLATSSVKLAAGSVCMILGFRWFALCGRLFNTLWETLKQSGEVLGSVLKKFCTNALDLLQTFANRFGDICARISASIARSIIWAGPKIKVALDYVWKKISATVPFVLRMLGELAKGIEHLFGNFCTALDYAREQISAAGRFVWRTLGELAKGIQHLFGNFLYAGYHTIEAGASVLSGGVNASTILLTAIIMGLGAIFFETGASNIVSGLAKSLFILTEGVAAAVGSILDGVVEGRDNLFTAVRSLIGHRRAAIAANATQEIALQPQMRAGSEQQSDANFGSAVNGQDNTLNQTYSKSLNDSAHQFNSLFVYYGSALQDRYLQNMKELSAKHTKINVANNSGTSPGMTLG